MKLKKLILAAALLVPAVLTAGEITDMAGRKVTVPDKITRVYGNPTTMNMVAPDLICALSSKIAPKQKKYLLKDLQNLPVIGGIAGQGWLMNYEKLMTVSPDIILDASWGLQYDRPEIEKMHKLKIPVVTVLMQGIEGYPAEFRFLGKLLGREKRCEELALYTENILKEMKTLSSSVPEKKRKTVYYAEGADGLQTEGADSMHATFINIIGAVNANRQSAATHAGMERINMEQVILMNPDVIIAEDESFYEKIFTDKRWAGLKAVKEKQVYRLPKEPFNWMDRPPSSMRIMGIQWAAKAVYPEYYKKPVVSEAVKFFKLFFNADLTVREMEDLMLMKDR